MFVTQICKPTHTYPHLHTDVGIHSQSVPTYFNMYIYICINMSLDTWTEKQMLSIYMDRGVVIVNCYITYWFVTVFPLLKASIPYMLWDDSPLFFINSHLCPYAIYCPSSCPTSSVQAGAGYVQVPNGSTWKHVRNRTPSPPHTLWTRVCSNQTPG